MLKKEVRKLYREKRNALTEGERAKLDDLLLIRFQAAGIPFLHTLLTYWPIEENNEPDTHLFTEFLRFRNPELRICYPVSDFKTNLMVAVAVDIDTPFEKTHLNIYEPQKGDRVAAGEIDLVIVPMLAFDSKGYRVGYGKGFYDKFLSGCRDNCVKAGFTYFEPVDLIDDSNEFDVPLNLYITPHSSYVF
jgi:5-formyltetrahydrofolate cyclo-ligase